MSGSSANNVEHLRSAGKHVNSLADGAHYASEVDNARVPDDAWGLLGQVYFHGKYEDLLEHFTGHLNKMVHGLQSAGKKVDDTADSVHQNDRAVAEQFEQIHQQLSKAGAPPKVGGADAAKSQGWAPGGEDAGKAFGGDAYKGVKDAGKFLGDLNEGTAGTDISNDVTSVLSSGAGIASDVGSFASDPLGWLIQKGVSAIIDLIAPLKKCLDMVTGNGDAVTKAAGNFNKVGKDIEHTCEQFEQALNKGFAQSHGDATEAARERLSDFRDGIAGTAGRSGDIAQLLQFTSMIMKAAEDFIKGIITDVIEFILMSQAAGAVLSFFTFGATEVAATAADTAKVAQETVKTEKKVKDVSDLLDETASVWQKIGAKFLDHKGGDAMKKMVHKSDTFEIAGKHGVKNTLKESAANRGAKTAGVSPHIKTNEVDGSSRDVDGPETVTGIADTGSKAGQAIEYGTRGDNASDRKIEKDLDT